MKFHWRPGNGTIAILLASLTFLLLAATEPAIGMTTDEKAYIPGAESYATWIWLLVKHPSRAIDPIAMDSAWSVTHEHPPVEMIWSGLVWLATRHWVDDLAAYRLGPMLLVALLVALLYLMVAGKYGKPSGLFAVGALLSMPRFFFHAHLAALDVPVAVASFAVIFVFWKTIDRKGWAWGILWGVAWGLAVAVKLNAVLIPIALVAWSLIFRRKWSVALRLFLMGMSAMLTFFLVWPWLYHQTWARVMEYVNFHLHHDEIGQWYLGQFYMPPPWHAVFVILWAVVPLTVMVLFLVGMTCAGKGKRDGGMAWLLILSAFVSISPFIFGKSLLYDNERLFMPVFPFLAALSGAGFGRLVNGMKKLAERVRRPSLALPAATIIGLGLLLPQSITMAGLYPHLLSYYSEGVGGLPGATQMGLETTYWSETFAAAVPYINLHAQPGDIIWSEDNDLLRLYQRMGRLRPDVQFYKSSMNNYEEVAWFIFIYRQSLYGFGGEDSFPILQILKDQTPVYRLSYQNVPLMDLYGGLK